MVFFCQTFFAQDCSLIWLLVAIFWFSWFSAFGFGFGFLVLVEGARCEGNAPSIKSLKLFDYF